MNSVGLSHSMQYSSMMSAPLSSYSIPVNSVGLSHSMPYSMMSAPLSGSRHPSRPPSEAPGQHSLSTSEYVHSGWSIPMNSVGLSHSMPYSMMSAPLSGSRHPSRPPSEAH